MCSFVRNSVFYKMIALLFLIAFLFSACSVKGEKNSSSDIPISSGDTTLIPEGFRITTTKLSFSPDQPYKTVPYTANFYDSPDGTLKFTATCHDVIYVTGEKDGYYEAYLENNGTSMEGYVKKSDIAEDSVPLYALLPDNSKDGKIDRLVDVRRVIPSADYYMVFATDYNYTGHKLYPRDICLLQEGTAQKLKIAQEKFMADGYCLKIYDAYRPQTVQKEIFDYVGDERYVADYRKAWSNHNRGVAVDISLTDQNGVELQMPTPPQTFDIKSQRDHAFMWTAEEKANVDYLTSVMVSCGFTTIPLEWWHYVDSERQNYLFSDLDFKQIQMIPVK